MPRYVISGILLEAEGLLNLEDAGGDLEANQIVLCLGLRGRDPGHQSAVARIGPTGTCVWDEEFYLLVDIPARDFPESTLHVEVLLLQQKRCGRRASRRLLATGSLRLHWMQELEGHCHPRLALPLTRRHRCPRAPPQLRCAMLVLGPGDAAPPPGTWSRYAGHNFEMPTKPRPRGARLPRLPAAPRAAALSFTMVGLWDLQLTRELKERSSADLTIDLNFRIEAKGDADELVLLDARMSEVNSKWQLPIDSPGRKVGIQLPRTYSAEFSLPASVESAELVIEVRARAPPSEGSEVVFEGDARLPLTTRWPRRKPGSSRDQDVELFGKVPLFPPKSSRPAAELAAMLEGLDTMVVPGSVGTLKCAYAAKRACTSAADEAGGGPASCSESLAEEADSLPNSAPLCGAASTAAAHTHDQGYAKWASYDVETALLEVEGTDTSRARKRKQGQPQGLRTIRAKPNEEAMEAQSGPAATALGCEKLGELLEAASLLAARSALRLKLYVHDALLTHLPEGLGLGGETMLEVLLGDVVVASGSSSNHVGRTGLLDCQFRMEKEIPLQMPRDGRCELRLLRRCGADRFVLGSTVLDLQDLEWSAVDCYKRSEAAKSMGGGGAHEVWQYPCEWRQILSPGSGLLSAGSLQCWAFCSVGEDLRKLPAEPWPNASWTSSGELRAILHEVRSDRTLGATEVVACAELEQPFERLHHCRLPSPQYSDVRPLVDGSCVSFEWRFVFPRLQIVSPVKEISLVVTIFDAHTWKILGRGMCPVQSALAAIPTEAEGCLPKPAPANFSAVQVYEPGRIHAWGSLRLSARALSSELAARFPISQGRESGPVPFDADNPKMVSEEAFAGKRLCCVPPARDPRPASRPRRSQRRRRAIAVAVFLLGLGAAAAAHLWKDASPSGDSALVFARLRAVWPRRLARKGLQ